MPSNEAKTPSSNGTSSPKSRFLVFEGLDGSGKSTLIQNLEMELRLRHATFVVTREPGGTELAEEIRSLLLKTGDEAPVAATELLLYAASRAQHVAMKIKPALEKGQWVLCDRFLASSVAFQCFARGLSRANTDWLNQFAIQGTQPDLTILLDLTVDESLERQKGRAAKDRMESEAVSFHERVRHGYLAQAKENPSSWLVLDARRSPEELKHDVLKELARRGWID